MLDPPFRTSQRSSIFVSFLSIAIGLFCPTGCNPAEGSCESNADCAGTEYCGVDAECHLWIGGAGDQDIVGGDTGGPGDTPPITSTLLAEPSLINTAPALVVCLDLDWFYADGTRTPVDPSQHEIDLVVSDPSIAGRAQADDCPVVGVVGIGSGSTAAEITVQSGVSETSILMPVEVKQYSVEVDLYDMIVLAGTTAPLTEMLVRIRDSSNDLQSLPGAHMVMRLLDLEVDDPTVAEVSFDSGAGQFLVTGLNVGATELNGTYGSAAASRPVLPASITVPGTGQVTSLINMKLHTDNAGDQALRCFYEYGSAGLNMPDVPVAPGECFAVSVEGSFSADDGVTWSQNVAASFSAGASLVADDNQPQRFCIPGTMAPNDAWVHACFDGACVRGYFPVHHPGQFESVAVTTPDGPTSKESTTPGGDIYCPDISVTLVAGSGANTDVTTQPAAVWRVAYFDSTFEVYRFRDAWGVGHDVAGRPCFEVTPSPDAVTTVRMLFKYASLEAFVDLELAP